MTWQLLHDDTVKWKLKPDIMIGVVVRMRKVLKSINCLEMS